MGVTGLGGIFFRANDPDELKSWYREMLGVGGGCGSDAAGESSDWFWFPESAGPIVFEPFRRDSDYFAADKPLMLNFRVRDLDSLLEQLNAAGVAVTTNPDWDAPGMGRFARIHDPEGNPIELWEPPAPDAD